MTMNTHPLIGNIRNIADLILNGDEQLDDCYIENWLSHDTAAVFAKTDEEYQKWYDALFPGISLPNSDSQKAANEAHRIIWNLVNAREQAACERGMKAGAKLIVDLLDLRKERI